MSGKIKAISISSEKGMKKQNINNAILLENFGIVNDAHAEKSSKRQVSLLAFESIQRIINKGLKVKEGEFAENITTIGLDLVKLNIGDKLLINKEVILEITQKGKECHNRCYIFNTIGDCIMPKEGVFAKVIKGGIIKAGDTIEVIK